MQYPGLPNNRLIVNGVDLSVRFQIALIDGYELNPPEPKTYTVDIPGGNGVIDLTEALTGDVSYNNRSQKFTFVCINPNDFEKVKTKISNFLHGRFYDYKITMDPDYTYHGRFKVTSYSHTAYSDGKVGTVEIEIDAKPYKTKEKCVYKLNATGGKEYRFESGRRLVHPVIECEQTCFVTFDNVEYVIPAGSHRLNNILFREGFNNIYINTSKLWYVKWDEISESGAYQMTWGDARKYRWDDIQKLGGDVKDAPSSWREIANKRWSDLSTKKWRDLDYRRANLPETTAYLSYDWEDL